jgi:hypothetical protein
VSFGIQERLKNDLTLARILQAIQAEMLCKLVAQGLKVIHVHTSQKENPAGGGTLHDRV